MIPFKGSRACLLAVLVPIMLPQVIPEPLRWIGMTLAILWVLKRLGILTIAFGSRTTTEGDATPTGAGSSKRTDSAHEGEIVALGSAPYEFDEANSLSYYITLRSERGDDKTLWGVDLRRVAHETPLAVGEMVSLEFLGRKAVVVDQPVRNDQGKVVNTRKVNTHRNTWQATVLPI